MLGPKCLFRQMLDRYTTGLVFLRKVNKKNHTCLKNFTSIIFINKQIEIDLLIGAFILYMDYTFIGCEDNIKKYFSA